MQDFRVETFLTACRTMNYTRAAEELRITQPAVSQHIAHLERVYGARLFEYRGKRLSLTPEGRMLRDALSVMVHDEALLRNRIAAAASGALVELAVGMTLTAGEYLVAAPLAEYLARHPEYRAAVRSGDTQELLGLLDAGTIDCAFVEGFFDKSSYAWNVYRSERFVCVCAPGHKFARYPQTLEDMLDEHVLVREPGSGTRAVLEHALAARNLTVDGFRRMSEVESLNVIKAFAERDLGIAFLYEAAVRREVAAGTLRVVELDGFDVRHDISFVRLPDSAFEAEFRLLFEELTARAPA